MSQNGLLTYTHTRRNDSKGTSTYDSDIVVISTEGRDVQRIYGVFDATKSRFSASIYDLEET